jgi:hypothetical protein
LLRAEQVSRSAAMVEISAREQWDAYIVFHSNKLAEAHEAVRGSVVGLEALESIFALEHRLQEEAAALRSALAHANENRRTAEAAVADASTALRFEIKVTHRRERLADRMRVFWSLATEVVAEAERDEQAIQSWTAV